MNDTILVLSLNPTLQKTTLFSEGWKRGEVNRSAHYSLTVSGKGANTARILAQLDENVTYLTQLGGRNREFFLEEMRKEGVKVFWDDSESEIRYCQTLISQNPFDVTEIIEEGEPVSEQTDRSLRDHFTEALSIAGWLIITGSCAPGFSDTIYLDCAAEAAAEGIPLILDINTPHLIEFLKYKPALIKINAYEFALSFLEDYTGGQDILPETLKQISEKAAELSSNGTSLVITQGAGDILLASEGQVERFTPEPIEVINPIGCGDAMTAGMTSALRQGKSIQEALEYGMACAARNAVQLAPGSLGISEVEED